ncbi:hypothetical protein BHM03_00044787 [Ensete ventricosum]|nr:hypothetical protein BHM03_00044787 [Ensete ventricosum]
MRRRKLQHAVDVANLSRRAASSRWCLHKASPCRSVPQTRTDTGRTDTGRRTLAGCKAGREWWSVVSIVLQVEKIRARDPEEKAEAERQKEERKYEAEAEEEAAKERHAAEREAVRAGGAVGGGVAGYPAGQTPVASGDHPHAGGRGSTTGSVF